MRQALRLALADLRRDWALSLCQAFALAAVLTPLLVLAGLRAGVLGQLMDELRRNPAMREIGPLVTGANRFTPEWIAAAAARPDVAFVAGDARFTAAGVEAQPRADPTRAPVVLTLVPTGASDPLRPAGGAWPGPGTGDGPDQAVLTARAAEELGAKPGDLVDVRIPRNRDGADQSVQTAVRVAAVLPPDALAGRRAMLADPGFVLAVQEFRDGYGAPARGWPGAPSPAGPPHYERFRMYARSIDDVETLTLWLRGQGIEPVSRVADIAPVRALDHGLAVVLLVVAGFAAAGLAVAIAAIQFSSVQRKRRELALLALIGYGRGFLIGVALLESLLLTAAGIAVSLGLFRGAAASIDTVFARLQRLSGPACALGAGPLAGIAGATLLLALAPSALAAWRIARIEPAGVLRET